MLASAPRAEGALVCCACGSPVNASDKHRQGCGGENARRKLDRLQEILDIAHKHELDVSVAVLDSWLSGFVFMPAWVGEKNVFTDASTVESNS